MADGAPAGGSRRARLVLVPLALLVGVTALVYGLARWQPLEKGSGAAGAAPVVVTGDPERGAALFAERCAGCHGAGGAGGGVGPALAGRAVSLGDARAVIAGGRGVMPAGLVAGGEEEDVVAYLDTVLAPAGAGAP